MKTFIIFLLTTILVTTFAYGFIVNEENQIALMPTCVGDVRVSFANFSMVEMINCTKGEDYYNCSCSNPTIAAKFLTTEFDQNTLRLDYYIDEITNNNIIDSRNYRTQYISNVLVTDLTTTTILEQQVETTKDSFMPLIIVLLVMLVVGCVVGYFIYNSFNKKDNEPPKVKELSDDEVDKILERMK